MSATAAPRARPAYSEVMEDHAVVARALATTERDVAVIVASAGDNVLNALLEPARRVFGVDLAPAQIELCRLKEAALRAASWTEFAKLVGSVPATAAERRAALERLPADLVDRACGDPAARAIALEHGLAACGDLAEFVAPLRAALADVFGPSELERLLTSPDRDERERIWRERGETASLRGLLDAALNEQTIANAFIPAFAFQRMAEPRFGLFYHRVLRHLTVELDPRGNHFLHRLWLGRFVASDVAPPYLLRANHERLRARLDALSWHRADLLDFLRTMPDASVDAFNLSNVLDWSEDGHHDELWREVDRAAAPGARAFLRSFLARRDPPRRFVERWTRDASRSIEMAAADRVGYFSRYELWTRASA